MKLSALYHKLLFVLTLISLSLFANSQSTIVVTAAGPGGGPHIKVFDAVTENLKCETFAYDASMNKGVRVAAGPVTVANRSDVVTAAGFGAGAHLRVFNGDTCVLLREWFAYDINFIGGVYVAVGDVTGSGIAKVITAPGPGIEPMIKIWDAVPSSPVMLGSFLAYDSSIQVGVSIAAGDLDGDGKSEIVTGLGKGGLPIVRIFKGLFGQISDEFIAPVIPFSSDSPYNRGIQMGVSTDDIGNPAIVVSGSEFKTYYREYRNGDCPGTIGVSVCFTHTLEFISVPVILVLLRTEGVTTLVSQFYPDLASVETNIHGTLIDNALVYTQYCPVRNGFPSCNWVNLPTWTGIYPDYSVSVAGMRLYSNTPVSYLLMGSPTHNKPGGGGYGLSYSPIPLGMVRLNYFASSVRSSQPFGNFLGGVNVAVDVLPIPLSASIEVGDGSAQRSMVHSIKITFSEVPTFPNGINNAFQVSRIGSAGPLGNVILSAVQSGNLVTIYFNDSSYAPVPSGATMSVPPSLIDGRYEISILGMNLSGCNSLNFHRLFGDTNGDSSVSANDFTVLRTLFGSSVTSSPLDYNQNGSVDSSDFIQFRLRFGSSL